MSLWQTLSDLPKPYDEHGRYRPLLGLPRVYHGSLHRPPGVVFHYTVGTALRAVAASGELRPQPDAGLPGVEAAL